MTATVRSIAGARERFLSGGEAPIPLQEVRPEILASWARCRDHNVPTEVKVATLAAPGKPSSELEQLLLDCGPLLRLFEETAEQCSSYAVISDERGRLLWMAGERRLLRFAADRNVVEGSVWGEELAGTNGVGTVLETGIPLAVQFAEHFCEGWQAFACIGAPIRHPVSGKVVGAYDVAGVQDASPDSIAQTRLSARLLEREWLVSTISRTWALRRLAAPYQRLERANPFLLVDPWGFVAGGNTLGLRLIGMSAEQPSADGPLRSPAPPLRTALATFAREIEHSGREQEFELPPQGGWPATRASGLPLFRDSQLAGVALVFRDSTSAVEFAEFPKPHQLQTGGRASTSRLVGIRDGLMHVLDVRTVIHAKFEDRCVWLFTPEGKFLSTYRTLSALHHALPTPPFFPANRGDTVNLNFVTELAADTIGVDLVVAHGGQKFTIPVSRRRVTSLREYLHF